MIRQAIFDDFERIADLHIYFLKHLRKTSKKYGTNYAIIRREFIKKLKNLSKDEKASILVYVEKEKVIGFCIGRIKPYPVFINEPFYGEIYEAVTDEKHQKKGVARKLVNEVFKFFKSKGVKHSELVVDSKNETAVKAWNTLGYKEETKIMRRTI